MARCYTVTVADEGGDTILTTGSPASEIAGIIIEDALASDVFGDLSAEDRASVIQAVVALNGVAEPFPPIVEVSGRTYRIEELPDDSAALDEFWQVKLASSTVLRLVCRLPSKLRYEIWPNESQHRGRPHCKVSATGKSATFSIPEGALLAGDLKPHETEAKRTIQAHAETLMKVWLRTRPDDQRL